MTIVDTPERRQLRELTRAFVTREVLPHLADWERAGEVPRQLHATAAKTGLLGIGFPEAVGGSGGDLLDSIIVTEEIIRSGGSSGLVAALFTHGIALPHMVAAAGAGSGGKLPRRSGDAPGSVDPTGREHDLIDRYVRPTLAGSMIGALAITEPDGGSDVAGIRTHARLDGDHYVVNGAKTYITSGVRADFVTTAVRTGVPGGGELSLLVIDKGTPGFTVGRRLDKLGWHCSDTAELSFVDVRVPVANRIGEEDTGFLAIMQQFAAERLSLATQAYAIAQRCVELAVSWCRDRSTFGRPLASRQLVRHRLAEMHTRAEAARAYVHQVAARVAAGEPVVTEVAMAKNVAVSAADRVVDQALQLHGGFGYLRDAEVERHYRDARILGIGGGTTEIMNEIIAKGMGL
ncbi:MULTISPECIES: acyl-CoA dehydrogenase family protein [unclassified Micromonospora]|uniref:acyl-CoA dehydrogenase family protein n=1 Tax=unclassified Micromonospora TaxID=2617518 RepID=UPI0022B6BD04|nr:MULTISPECIES: acyl-CoA dehydrogenase family protein [unclassified Micromonospora]MCZ7419481.1 acyl-CoA dehydrogenase family protein [Verrucosispora sp. WMMA2121]WBB93114.1 acyl-CoA dehydrogenase family protein [Verrucosispora sp. WMMC514]